MINPAAFTGKQPDFVIIFKFLEDISLQNAKNCGNVLPPSYAAAKFLLKPLLMKMTLLQALLNNILAIFPSGAAGKWVYNYP